MILEGLCLLTLIKGNVGIYRTKVNNNLTITRMSGDIAYLSPMIAN